MGKPFKFEGESIGQRHRQKENEKKDLNLSEKTDILVVGKEVIVLCVEGSRALILRKRKRVNGIIALKLAFKRTPPPTPPKKKLAEGSMASMA